MYAVLAAVALALALRTPAPFAKLENGTGSGVSLAAVRAAWGDSLVRRLCLFAFIPFGTFIALTTWTQALLEPAGVSVDQVGVILISCVLAGVVGTVVIPLVAVRRRKEIAAGVIATVVTVARVRPTRSPARLRRGPGLPVRRRPAAAADARDHPRARRAAHGR